MLFGEVDVLEGVFEKIGERFHGRRSCSEDRSITRGPTHLEETIVHVERLEQVFKLIDKAPRGKKCEAILGIIKEAEELMQEAETDTVRDAAMVGAAQAVEHYEISRYGTLKAWASKLGREDAAELLDETLQEEKATDEKLSELAESEINVEADDQPIEHEGEMKSKRPAASR